MRIRKKMLTRSPLEYVQDEKYIQVVQVKRTHKQYTKTNVTLENTSKLRNITANKNPKQMFS